MDNKDTPTQPFDVVEPHQPHPDFNTDEDVDKRETFETFQGFIKERSGKNEMWLLLAPIVLIAITVGTLSLVLMF